MADSILLVHPTCGTTQPGDIEGVVRIQTYEALRGQTQEKYPMSRWAYLPYSMKMAGLREAIQHMMAMEPCREVAMRYLVAVP